MTFERELFLWFFCIRGTYHSTFNFGVFGFMTLAKRLSISFAAIATALTVGAIVSAPAQAKIITGSVIGTWDDNYGQGANVNVGDTFTADYSYDDATLTFSDYSQPGFFQDFAHYGSLLSLVVNSGSYSHDFSNDSTSVYLGDFKFEDSIGDPSSRSSKYFAVGGNEDTAPGLESSFSAVKQVGEDSGEPFSYFEAGFYTLGSNVNYPNGVSASSDVQFTPDPTAVPTPDPTAVPEPALLSGLIGLGVGLLRKRKVEAANQTSEV